MMSQWIRKEVHWSLITDGFDFLKIPQISMSISSNQIELIYLNI